MKHILNRLRKAFTALMAVLATLTLAGAPTALADMQGIDVSSWQPANVTRWIQADFAIVKVTQGTGYVNPYYPSQAAGTIETGKSLGLYHYAAGGNPSAEADYFLAQSAEYIGTAILVLDWESNQNAAWGNGNWVAQFVDRVHDRVGVWPIIYVQASAINQIPQRVWDNCGLWVAQYANMNATGYQSQPWLLGRYGEVMRQYTSTGRLPGYSGNLDLNIFRGEKWQWDAYANPRGAHKPSATIPQQTTTGGSKPGANMTAQCVTVQAGDSLSAIAARYGGSWSDWGGYRSGNPNVIYAGERVCRNGTGSPASPVQGTSGTGSLRVVVQSGDTISAIAARHNAYPLSAWSVPSGNINLIYPGQTVVYNGASASAAASVGTRVYTVKAGDCLSVVFPSNWRQVASANGIANPNLIHPGQVIRY